jgi:hypothetical protein
MTAQATDKFMEVGVPGSATTLSAPGYTIGNSSITVGSTANWPTTTGVAFAIDVVQVVNSVEVRVDGTYCEFVGTVSGGSSVTNVALTYGNPQNYAAGALTRVYIPVSSTRENRLADGLLVEHNQDGTHGAITSTNAALTTPKIITGVNDTNGNSLIKVAATASAVNQVTVTNAATTHAPTISATGSDSNVTLSIVGKGVGGVTLQNPYKFRVYRSAAQNTGNNAATVVLCDTKTYDTGSNVDVTTNKGRFTAPIAGFYQFNGCTGISAASGTTVIYAALYKNGSLYSQGSLYGSTAGTSSVAANVSDIISLAANDYVELWVFCNGTAAMVSGTSTNNYFSGSLVSTT